MSTIGLIYSSKDAKLVDKLRVHLAPLRRQGHSIIEPGTYDAIEECDVLLIFLSPYFLDKELLIDLALHAAEQRQCIVPIILRDINKNGVPEQIRSKSMLPRNQKPVVRQNVDRAFSEVHQAIDKILEEK